MTDRLAAGFATLDMPAIWPVEANEVFMRLPRELTGSAAAGPAVAVTPA